MATGAEEIRHEPRRVPGEPGIWVLVFADLLVFTALFAAFLVNRGQEPDLFRAGQEQLSQASGIFNTLLLVTSSLFVFRGVRALHDGGGRSARRAFVGAIACGVAFVVSKYLEYSDKSADGVGPSSDEFFQYFYLMTGLHLFHVVIGLGALVYMALQSRGARTRRRLMAVEVGATYWHMVDLLWIVLFALLYAAH